jgi:hypothetical protein
MPVSSVERPVSALRQRMLEDMAMRGLRSDTQRDYVRVVRSFAVFLGQPPDTAKAEDIRRFQVHQRESGVQPPTINCSVSASAIGEFRIFGRLHLKEFLLMALERSRTPARTACPKRSFKAVQIEESATLAALGASFNPVRPSFLSNT